jgi:hypothetical protein
MARVLVIGSGPAGLSAAEALLDGGGGKVEVELVTLEHHIGGKASSWRDREGRTVEHAQHVVLGFYTGLKGLLRRSGVRPADTLVSSQGHYRYWEDRDQRAHELYVGDFLPKVMADWIRYTGFSHAEKHGITRWVVRMALEIGPEIPEELDDLCFSAWALSRGLPVSVAATNLFRASREAQLNWPGEISAYAMLRTLREAIRVPGRYLTAYPNGGMTELWWEPIARRIEGLGGGIVRRTKLCGLQHDGERLTGVDFAMPVFHGVGNRFHGPVPIDPATRHTRSDFDAVVSTIPVSSLQQILPPDLADRPGFSGIGRLTHVAPLGLQIWHRNTARVRPGMIVGGLEPPLGFMLDNKANYTEYRDDPSIGSVLHFAGQLAGFERDDDEAILTRAIRSVRKVDGFEMIDREGVLHHRVLRHTAPFARYWNAEPGSLRFKPRSRTPLQGFYLAGDWVRNECDFPCMESAVRSGREAATCVLDDLSRRARRGLYARRRAATRRRRAS